MNKLNINVALTLLLGLSSMMLPSLSVMAMEKEEKTKIDLNRAEEHFQKGEDEKRSVNKNKALW